MSAGKSCILLFIVSCSAPLLMAEPEQSQERAVVQERASCGREQGELDARLLAPDMIQRVEPLYVVTQTKHGTVQKLRGAALRLWARPEVTSEWLHRVLRCHSARALQGQVSEVPNDPYWLPNAWVDIDVRSDGDGFQVELRGVDREQSQRILDRARAFTSR